MLRDDLEILVAEAHRLGFYTNLLTSGVGLTDVRAAKLKEAGLDHIQLSFQDSTRELNDFLSHTRTFELKQRVAHLIKSNGWPMVLNCVIHRMNIDYIGEIIGLPATMDLDPAFPVMLEAGSFDFATLQFTPSHRARRLLTFRFDRGYEAWRRRVQGGG